LKQVAHPIGQLILENGVMAAPGIIAPGIIAPDVTTQVVIPPIDATGVNPIRQLTQTLLMQLQPAVHIAELRTLPTPLPMHCPPTGAKPEMHVMQVMEFKHVRQFIGHCE